MKRISSYPFYHLSLMLIYILLFFFLSFMCFFALVAIFLIKCLGLVPLSKKIINKMFSHKYDRKFSQQGQQPINTDCYVCLEKCKQEVIATCNHSFCSKCILQYAESRRGQSINCPACRKQICILFRRFEATTPIEKDLKQKVAEFNCTNSKEIGFFRSIIEFPNIIRQVGVLFSAQGLKYLLESPRIKSILLLLFYTLSPVDLMPQMLLGPLGLADDALASMELLRQFSNLWIQFVRDQSQRQRLRA